VKKEQDHPLAELEERIGYEFQNPEILQRALRHGSSVASDFAGSYQRLEFLGDAVLGHVVALMLFERFPKDDQGDLTRKRTHLVRSERLAERAALLGLDGWIEVGQSLERGGGRESKNLLEDVFEAVVGAIAIDGGWEEARAFITRQLGDEVDGLDERTLMLANPKSALQEAAQAGGMPLPEYKLIRKGGTDHMRKWVYTVTWDDEVIARGEGRSKRGAQQRAARRALVRLGLVPED
jgi:ribonuclease III